MRWSGGADMGSGGTNGDGGGVSDTSGATDQPAAQPRSPMGRSSTAGARKQFNWGTKTDPAHVDGARPPAGSAPAVWVCGASPIYVSGESALELPSSQSTSTTNLPGGSDADHGAKPNTSVVTESPPLW